MIRVAKPVDLTEFNAGLAIVARLASRDPSHTGWQREHAVAHGFFGDVHLAIGEVEKAASSYRSRIAILERLTKSDPRNADWQVGFANSHALLADVFIAEGNLGMALESYRTSHRVWEQVAASDPTNVEWQLELLWSHARLALFLDDPAKRTQVILLTLHKLKEDKKLTAEQERWLSFAEEADAAVRRGAREF
jgi:tetratricopeptide (TPR) repeat protein